MNKITVALAAFFIVMGMATVPAMATVGDLLRTITVPI